MRLSELEPRWIGPDTFAFRCPHCRGMWLTCTMRAIPRRSQLLAVQAAFPGNEGDIVTCNPKQAWAATSRDFETMTVTPSLDASKAGHWHGHIKNGAIV